MVASGGSRAARAAVEEAPRQRVELPPPRPCAPDAHQERFTLEDRPGWRCVTADGVGAGPFVTTFPDGSVEISGAFERGLLEGRWRRRYRNGHTAEVGAYVEGKKDGLWQLYNDRGGLLGDYAMKRGTGVEKRWYLDGALASERAFVDGVLEGPSVAYAKGGEILYRATFRAGALHGPRHVGVRGALQLEDQWRAGVPFGTRRIWRREFLALEQTFDDDGVRTGPYTAWRDRSSLRERGAYLAGDRHGTWRWYDRARALEREGTYYLGVRHGLWRQWEGGGLRMLGRYVKGRPHGVFTFWNGAGRVTGTAKLRNGTGKMLTFHDNGVPSTRTSLVRGVKHGSFQELTPRGRVVVDGAYLDDLRDGRWREREVDGSLLREATYQAGALHGVVRRYAEGRLASELTYVRGRREGPYRELRVVGEKATESVTGAFSADRRSGEWVFHGRDGAPTLVMHYEAGALHGAWSQLDGDRVLVRGQYERGQRSGTWTWLSPSGETVRTVTYDAP